MGTANRHPAGTPAGGRFAPGAKPEADLLLTDARAAEAATSPYDGHHDLLVRGKVLVEWTDDGEGYGGSYDPLDPHDEPLLRFTVWEYRGDAALGSRSFAESVANRNGWEPVEYASYCTNVPTHADPDVRRRLLVQLMDAIHDVHASGGSIKRACEEFSWAEPGWVGGYPSPDAA